MFIIGVHRQEKDDSLQTFSSISIKRTKKVGEKRRKSEKKREVDSVEFEHGLAHL